MAPISSTVALSHVDGVSDSARARELYKYYQPSIEINQESCFPGPAAGKPSAPPETGPPSDVQVDSDITSSKVSSPDTTLTAFCQLVTWRTGAQRAMISLIDSSTQYFIAESTKTLDLVDNTKHSPGDDLWMGCGSVTKAGRLCERTIAVQPTTGGDYPCFVVTDLSTDERFNQLPFVTEAPFLKLYAGVPLITKRGIPIGSLFIVDDRLWENGLSKDEINFMGTMAVTIMKHMEMAREVEEHRRGMKMSRGLASFVEGRSQLLEADLDAEDGEGSSIAGQFETERLDSTSIRTARRRGSVRNSTHSIEESVNSIERKEREYSNALQKTQEAIQTSHDIVDSQTTRPLLESESNPNSFEGTSIASPPTDHVDGKISSLSEDASEGTSMKLLFSRASNLIREAFEVDGGAVFYDAQRGFGEHHQQLSLTRKLFREDSHPSDDGPSGSEVQSDFEDKNPSKPFEKQPYSLEPGEGMFSRSSRESKKAVEILGFSTAQASSINSEEYPGPHSFIPFDEKSLHNLMSRYPRGKLWTFDSDGGVSSSSEEDNFPKQKIDPAQHAKDLVRRKKRSARVNSDARFLAKHFPGVRQLLFVPLWDAGRSRWLSACCAWSTEPTRILSKQSELAFLSAFGNSVMAECSRIDTEIADQKKGDFIGSISHELRSPLHGILASAEFLGEETLTGFERGLVETIDSCGRTLLDTINHILDFSKINHFEKNWRKNKRSGNRPMHRSHDSGLALRQSDLPMINLFADVDISVVCEEVIESVFAGHVFQNVTAQSFDMVPGARGKMADARNFLTNSTLDSEQASHSDVAVILDVDLQDYHFTTQPGAFRRVVMNLLGNALKYTSHGYVRVTLETKEMEDLQVPGTGECVPRAMVTLSVVDTGKGISSDFLRSKLFTPFAQENSLSSGTGLGLSIVRSIINLLEGEIAIDSEVGRGTSKLPQHLPVMAVLKVVEIKVTLPLLRAMPKSSVSSSGTPRSVASLPRETDVSVERLRVQLVGQKVTLCGFDNNSLDPVLRQAGQFLQDSIAKFLTTWYGLRVVPVGQKSGIIIANEASPATISKLIRQGTTNNKPPIVIVLCSHASRFDRTSTDAETKTVGFIAKPVGPLKLARALLQCIDGGSLLATPGLLDPSAVGVESNDLSKIFEELSLSPHGGEVLDNSRMAADSENARKAIESPTPNASVEKIQEFPFPVEDRPSLPKPPHSMPGDKESLAAVGKSGGRYHTTSQVLTDMETASGQLPVPETSTSSANKTTSELAAQPSLPKPHPPRLLLVDDNKINLTLLGTYMRKRKYSVIDEAENGLEAVRKFEDREDGYDIIFMDISMPVLDGFGATRQIRAIEEKRHQRVAEGVEKTEARTPALVIALTGLASSRDQSEAFSSGIDLFLTKPVAFKQVGKMLENWEANREKDLKAGERSSTTTKVVNETKQK